MLKLAVTMAKNPNEPRAKKSEIAEVVARSIRFEEGVLDQILGLCPRSDPPIREPVQEPLVILHPIFESRVVDLQFNSSAVDSPPFLRAMRHVVL